MAQTTMATGPEVWCQTLKQLQEVRGKQLQWYGSGLLPSREDSACCLDLWWVDGSLFPLFDFLGTCRCWYGSWGCLDEDWPFGIRPCQSKSWPSCDFLSGSPSKSINWSSNVAHTGHSNQFATICVLFQSHFLLISKPKKVEETAAPASSQQ